VVRATVKDRGVLQRNRIFAERLVSGGNPYEDGLHAPYPLAWALFHSAFLWMPERVERAVWATLQIALAGTVLALLVRILLESVPSMAPRVPWILAAALVVTSRYWLRDLAGGGSNLLILSLSFFGLYAYLRGREAAGAVPLGLACALKLTPLLFVPYLFLKRSPRFALLTTGCAAAFFLAPALVIGPERFGTITVEWARGVFGFLAKENLTAPGSDIIPFEWMNQSLRNALFRYLTECDHPHPLYVHGLHLSPQAATAIGRAAILALVGVSAWCLRRPRPRAHPIRFLAEVAWVYLLLLLLSPITWRAHFVASIPAVFLLCAHGLARSPGSRFSLAIVAIAFLLGGGTSEFFWGKEGKDLLQAYFPVTVSGLVLLAGLAPLLSGRSRFPGPIPPGDPSPPDD